MGGGYFGIFCCCYQNPFSAILRLNKTKKKKKKKVSMATKFERGGGKALVAGPLKKYRFFCGFPYFIYSFFIKLFFYVTDNVSEIKMIFF